jgi:hypothetical protein
MKTIATFGTGTKLLLAAGGLLLVDLFLTWQAVPVNFGRNGTVTKSLDAWDGWGLLIGLATLLVVILAVVREFDDGLAFDARWSRALLGLGILVFALVVLKNLRDSDSTWASYVGVVLAGLVAAGAYLNFTYEREPTPVVGQTWQPRDREQERSPTPRRASGDEATPRW